MSEKAIKTTEEPNEESEELEEPDSYDDFIDFEDQRPLESSKQEPVAFVNLTDVVEFIQERCKEVNELLSLQDDEALIILNHYKWRKDLIGNDWFENEEQLRVKIGLEPKYQMTLDESSEVRCQVCWTWKPRGEFDSLKCNHLICKDCWTQYILFNVTRFENTFFWKCPMEGCNIIVPDSFNQRYIVDEMRPQYQKKMSRAYTNTSRSFRWCPAVNCNYGVEVVDICAQAINCKCGQVFCFKCGQEDHRPCTCEVAEEWINNGGNKDTLLYKKWLLANTKNCPRCKKPIEKNRGCNHMGCIGCGYEFCWQCLENWNDHTNNDVYNCAKYVSMDQRLKEEIKNKKEGHKKNLTRSCTYYDHYKSCEKKIVKVENLSKTFKLENEQIKALGVSKDIVDFLQNACQTLLKTRRLVKWCYAYAFFINDEIGDELQSIVCEILQEKLDLQSVQLQLNLEELCSDEAQFSDYVECRDAIQSGEADCRLMSAEFLDKIEEMEDKLVEEKFQSKTDQGILSEIY